MSVTYLAYTIKLPFIMREDNIVLLNGKIQRVCTATWSSDIARSYHEEAEGGVANEVDRFLQTSQF